MTTSPGATGTSMSSMVMTFRILFATDYVTSPVCAAAITSPIA
jgi:hypothetical protein